MEPFDVGVANVARMYDYYLRGKDNFAADRAAAEKMIAKNPAILTAARANREYLGRAVTAVAGSGVTQFIDMGSGLPTADNTHQVAQRVDPEVRVAYIDRDPQAVTRGMVLLQDSGQEGVTVMDGDLREAKVLLHLLSPFIDFAEPVCLMFVAVLHFIESPDCYEILRTYMDRLAPGSYLILSHSTADHLSGEQAAVITDEYGGSNAPIHLRTRDEVSRFFDGLDVLEPGIVDVADWRAEKHHGQTTMVWGGVARKAA